MNVAMIIHVNPLSTNTQSSDNKSAYNPIVPISVQKNYVLSA